jgi:hypothetical protein
VANHAWSESWLEPEFTNQSPAMVQSAVEFRHNLEAFQKMGPKVAPFLLSELQDRRGFSSPRYRWCVAHTPLWFQPYLPRLRVADTDRRTADLILKQLGPAAYPVIPELTRMLAQGDNREKQEAIGILKRIGPAASNAVPVLNGLMQGSAPIWRVLAAEAICRIDPAQSAAMISILRQALEGGDEGAKSWALGALWRITRKPEYVLPSLISGLGKEKSHSAYLILKQCGPSASNAVPGLIIQLHSVDLVTRVAAALALSAVDPQAEAARVSEVLAEGKANGISFGGLE